jgi:hypothetical protein
VPNTALYLAFFCSGASGLIFQVVWVRAFGNVFGNTIHSAALVVAIFMLGLGVGGYGAGVWAESAVPRAAGIAAPRVCHGRGGHCTPRSRGRGGGARLGGLSALVSTYVQEPSGWFVLSTGSYVARGLIAVALVAPSAGLMGATLTLLIRHLVRADLETGSQRVALLYAANTAGAAVGCVLTDVAIVPALGLQRTQLVAAALNVVAALLAWAIATRAPVAARPAPRGRSRRAELIAEPSAVGRGTEPTATTASVLLPASVALACAGFAGLAWRFSGSVTQASCSARFEPWFSLLLGSSSWVWVRARSPEACSYGAARGRRRGWR